ncbi:MAG: adenylate/guanylate cyclase domain-containing protein [Inquilinus sp.]|nr:adenylate/guanylate cyclase domain-containing protein [Inquilinus sp.]
MADGHAGDPPPRRRLLDVVPIPRQVSLSITLATGIGLLVFIAVLAVLAWSFGANIRNTFGLLTDKAELTITLAESQLRGHLRPATDQVSFIAGMIQDGAVDPAEQELFQATLTGAMAAAPQIMALIFWDSEFRMTGVAQQGRGNVIAISEPPADAEMRAELRRGTSDRTGPFWGGVTYVPEPDTAALNLRQTVRRGDRIELVAAVVSIRELSRFLTDMDEGIDDAVPFILYGRDSVLAHPSLASDFPGLSWEKPLPTLFEAGDPILAALWTRGEPVQILSESIDALYIELAGVEHTMVYREIDGFGPVPLVLGVHFPTAYVSEEMRRLNQSAFVGLAVGVVAILLGVFMGRRIARPVIRLAVQASRIADLEFGRATPLPGSFFTELDDQARAFNKMLAGLKWFETYVPRTLVHRLLAKGGADSVRSVDRELTVLFTDIAGFTSISEGLTAAETAAFLNHHFALLAECIEVEGGTIDKFIGDAVMAFWGAPDRQPDHADRACRAALAIAEALRADNAERRAAGLAPVRLRIGIHSGPMVVGNIGAPGRMNYTIVGDAVNTGNRLEQLSKELADGDGDVDILISGATAGRLDADFRLTPRGRRPIRGRQEEIEVFRLG